VEEVFASVEEIPPQSHPTIGVELGTVAVLEHSNPFLTVGRGIGEAAHTLRTLLTPRSDVGIRHLMGVAGMARTLHRLSRVDLRGLLHFALTINVSLALLNLLPIPALDGGHICFAILEKTLGRSLPDRLVRWLHGCCLLALFALLAYVTALDLLRWRGESQFRALLRDQATLHRAPEF
jgi:regulator of sigma E protease